MFGENCDCCGNPYNSRIFTDSWTGLQVCIDCICEDQFTLVYRTTMSPDDEIDNFVENIINNSRFSDDSEGTRAAELRARFQRNI